MGVLFRLALLLCCGVCFSKMVNMSLVNGPNPAENPTATTDNKPEEATGSLSKLPPFVNQDTPLLEVLAGEERVFSLNAVTRMTASVRQSHAYQCRDEANVRLGGNMDCLISYWEFQPFSPSAKYSDFASPLRDECMYDIGFEECNPDASGVDLVVSSDVSSLVDGDEETVWAHRIRPGVDTAIVIDLGSTYEVIGLDMLVESVPLDVSVQIQNGHQPAVTVARVKQSCGAGDGDFCEDFLLMDGKYHAVAWKSDDTSDVTGDKVILTLHGETTFNDYVTNYLVIRDIRLLAKPLAQLQRKKKQLSRAHIMRLLRLIGSKMVATNN